MSVAKPKLSTKTPDAPEYNSTIENHANIVALPRERRYAIVEIKTAKVTRDVDSGEDQATLQLIHIEEPQSGADARKLEELLDSMFQKRTKLKTRANPHEEEDTPLDGLSSDLGGDDTV